jgi:hypothetical protein
MERNPFGIVALICSLWFQGAANWMIATLDRGKAIVEARAGLGSWLRYRLRALQ